MAEKRKSVITATSRGDASKTANTALARRLQSGRLHGAGSRTIPLKEPKAWHTYIANQLANSNNFLEMREKGWVPLEVSDLSCSVEESGFRLEGGHLVRGPHGQEEVVFKMAKPDYDLLVQAKTDANMRGIGSKSKVKSDLTEAVNGQFGDEAATYMNNLSGNVTDTITGGAE